MSRQVYLHGGPKDGAFVTIGEDWKEVVFEELPPPPCLSVALPPPKLLAVRYFVYRPCGRHTLQGVEVFECA